MTDDTLYRRKPSGRYVPVAVPDYDGIDDGTYTLTARAGRVARLLRVTDEDRAILAAAAEPARRAMAEAMLAYMRVRPDTRATTSAERRAWLAYVAALAAEGEVIRPLALESVSVWDVVDAGIKALVASTPAPASGTEADSTVELGSTTSLLSGGGREGGDARKGEVP